MKKSKIKNDKMSIIRKLNKTCMTIELKLKKEILQLNRDLLARLKKDTEDFLSDFMLEVQCDFYLNEDHIDWAKDQSNIVGSVKFHANLLPPYRKHDGYWSYLGKASTHQIKRPPSNAENICYLLSCLLAELDPSMLEKLFHIGRIDADIHIIHQHVEMITGKRFRSEKIKWPPIVTKDLL